MTATPMPRAGAMRPRHLLLVATVALTVIGCLCVLSAADGASNGSPFVYFAKAVGFGALGLGLMAYLGRGGLGGLELAHRLTVVLLVVGFAGVLFVLLPTPITPVINGARRWIQLPGMTIQPSEILKPALVLYLASVLAREPWRNRSLYSLRGPLLICGFGLMLVAKEDLGSALVTGSVVMIVLFAAATPGRVLGALVGLSALGAAMLTAMAPERLERLAVFLDPFKDRWDAGFQITNGLFAISSGGVAGRGIGSGIEKHIIPEPQTDFILPVIMEEVGLVGATLIMALYVAIIMLGFRIARGAKDPYERLVATGLTAIIMCQAALNIWVVMGIAPLTGVPLPLISAGGTSQVILLCVVGLLLDIDRRSMTPTISLVVPGRPPRVVAEPPAEVPSPEPGELRVVDLRDGDHGVAPPSGAPIRVRDLRRPRVPKPALPQRQPRAARPAPAPGPARASRPARARRQPAPAPRPAPQPARRAAPPAATRTPRVIERVGDLELLADGSVRLPSGRIGRPKSPMVLPDGRVLLPDGRVVSRERATLAARRQTSGS